MQEELSSIHITRHVTSIISLVEMQSIGAIVAVTLAGFIPVLGKQLSTLSRISLGEFPDNSCRRVSLSQVAVGSTASILRD